MKRLEGYRNFCNKLWNASRYALMNAQGRTLHKPNPEDYTLADRYINSKLYLCLKDVREAFDGYRFDLAASALYEFIWNELCDWYIELTKPVLWDKNQSATFGTEAQRNATIYNLLKVLEVTLRIAHPIMPFITEEIYKAVAPLVSDYKDGETIMLKSFPELKDCTLDEEALKDVNFIKEFIIAIRNVRAEKNIPPSTKLSVIIKGSSEEQAIIQNNLEFVVALANLDKVENASGEVPPSIAKLVGSSEVLIPMSGFIKKDEELARLDKELAKIQSEIDRVNNKLSNETFVAKAPAKVIDAEKEKLANYSAQYEKLLKQKDVIASL